MTPLETDQENNEFNTSGRGKNPWHQLLIIGNGFDLECGLNSTFEDFIAAERESFAPRNFLYQDDSTYAVEDWERATSKPGSTVWDLILKEKRKAKWCDIEGAILQQVSQIHEILAVLKTYNNYIKDTTTNFRTPMVNRFSNYRLSYDICRYILLRGSGRSFSSEQDVSLFLLNELNRLERAFAEYLRRQASDRTATKCTDAEESADTPYVAVAKNKLHSLLSATNRANEQLSKTYSILSFNYTGPFTLSSDMIGRCIAYTNIHGVCYEGEEIIFGIDGKDILTDENARPFTKTYRLLGMGGPQAQDVVTPSTRCIKFYGHSLSEADYSYFQTIFDGVHLYDSDVSLVFFYRCFDERAASIHRDEMMNKVVNLLTEYGETLENKDHGKNLIHKLLLEGRLSVTKIDFDADASSQI